MAKQVPTIWLLSAYHAASHAAWIDWLTAHVEDIAWRPLVPDALCYVEQFPDAYRYPVADVDALIARLVTWLTEGLPPPVDVSAWYGKQLVEAWHELLQPSRFAKH